uniref:pentatricopeptide repeat-containing protein At5g15280, mitochondrial n=1 Tax=Erigeron canadensis TaxID=72917 RepID=UPI001CB95370|nr:pentatricopeptide repeat-containing protein At5g15280, mitochondrial [Erigeron canadensis]
MRLTTLIHNRMLFTLQRKSHFAKVSNLFPFYILKYHYSCNLLNPQPNTPHIDSASVAPISGFTESILAKSSNLFTKTTHPTSTNASSLQELLLNVFHISPRITRKFWRKNELISQHFLDLLVCFESNFGKSGFDVKKVESLLGIFKWVSDNNENGSRGFKHVGKSFKVMAGLLVRARLFKDAEWVLFEMDKGGVLLDDCEVFGKLIEWYVSVDELEKSVGMYDRMREGKLVPTLSCYRSLVDYLVDKGESELVFRVFGDMVDMGLAEKGTYENVVSVLCRVGKVLESRNLVKKVYGYGMKPNTLILEAIASGYCEKKDYNDLLSLFIEIDCLPDVVVGNKILHSMCQNLGVVEAFKFLEELEHLGFTPDAMTFGILIGWSCKEGNLKNAFFCLSDILSRGLIPHKHSYNAIISGLFKEGMCNHANDIVLEMEDKGVTPDMSTFRLLLAGYCNNRKFDEVKAVIEMMVRKGLIELSPLQDLTQKAFVLLGIDPVAVRVRRDNDVKFTKTEFYDSVGNGLYLEGDVVAFDQAMISILDDSMILDYNRLILKGDGFTSIDELVHWGQEPSYAAFSMLIKKFNESNTGFKTITTLLEKMPDIYNELDEEALNLLVQTHFKRGFIHKGKKLFDKMVKKNLKIENKTVSALVRGLCKKGNSKYLNECWDLVQNKHWLPTLHDYRTQIYSFCQNNMVMEALFLYERVMLEYPQEATELLYDFIKKLCETGFTKVAHVMFEELLERGYDLNQVAYSHLLSSLCKENHFSAAFVMSHTMLDKCFSPSGDVYNALLHGYCGAKNLKKVGELLAAIVKNNITVHISCYSKLVSLLCQVGRPHYALSIKDLMVKQSFPHISLYNILIFHLFTSRNSVLLDTLLEEVQDKGLEFDSFTYNFLVYGFSQCNLISRSLHYLTVMISKELKPSNRSMRVVIRSLVKDGEFKKVLKLSKEMEIRRWVHCSVVQNEIVDGLLKMGKLQQADSFLENVILKDLVPDNINYGNKIKQMCHFGKTDKALDLLDTMLKRGITPDSMSYDCLVQGLCVSHKMEEALDLYTEMLNRKLNPSTKTYEVLTEKLCEFGRTFEAEKLIDAMISLGEQPSKMMFGSVVSRYRFERNFTKASELLQRMQQFGYKPDFETHWSLISTLSRVSDRHKDDNSSSFLSRLLSASGFRPKKGVDPKAK